MSVIPQEDWKEKVEDDKKKIKKIKKWFSYTKKSWALKNWERNQEVETTN